ncbi:MAG TPA: TolC family protein [Planctomycetota bacterium]|jgi:outer membrane protein TolC
MSLRIADCELRIERGLAVVALLLLIGCAPTRVKRPEEAGRFQSVLNQRVADLKIDTSTPLSMQRCIEIALQNNLDYRVRQLHLALQDEDVRLAMAGGLPKGDMALSSSHRTNAGLAKIDKFTAKMEDQSVSAFNLRAVIPILDWGATYYAWQAAKDRRQQEVLVLERTRQTLIRDVRIAYARLASLQRQEKLIRVGLLAARELLKVSQSLEREGLASRADTAVVEAGLAQAAEQWATFRRRIEEARIILAQSMSLPAGVAFNIEETAPAGARLPTLAEIQKLEESALQNRPELSAQDRERRIAALNVREQFARMLPRLDGQTSFDWTSSSLVVNPSFFRLGVQVADSLLDSGSQWWRFQRAEKNIPVEEERTLLLSLGVMYEVDFGVLQLYSMHDTVAAREAVVKARQEALRQVVSKYLEGLETGTDAIRALSEMYLSRVQLDAAQTEQQIAVFQIESSALAELAQVAEPGKTVESAKLPPFEPGPSLDNLAKLLEFMPPADLRQFPELEGLLKASRGETKP